MNTAITVREYARLTTETVLSPSLDRAQVSITAFDWLCNLSSTFSKSGAALVQVEDRRWLKLDNYVGVLETPCGTRLEILPKHIEEGDCISSSRALLQRMIESAIDLPVRQANETMLEVFNAPLSEWVMGKFLAALDHLIKRGVRSDYFRVEAEERYLRGQLNTVRQMRQPPGRQHVFQIRHDVFVPDCPENRLLKCALEQVCRLTKTSSQWRLAQELRGLFQEVPTSVDISADFKLWRKDRLMAHYQPVRPWCELVLYRQMPLSLVGAWHGISLLFPMEKLFERYVASILRKSLTANARLVTQATSKALCEHNGGPIFRLQPDLLIEHEARRWVLDTKWKRLDASDKANHYGLSQADFYQLFAYGQKYLNGIGEMILIYPKRASFTNPLPMFEYGGGLNLWVMPFDLENGCLVEEMLTSLPLTPGARSNPFSSDAFLDLAAA